MESACARVGMARGSAYRLRQHPDAQDFREAWAGAVQMAWAQLAEQALFRALNGEVVTHSRFVNGELVTVERHQPCDPRLLMALLARYDRRTAEGEAEQLVADRGGLLALHRMLGEFPDREGWVAPPDAAALASPAPAPLLPMAPVLLEAESAAHTQRARRPRLKDPARPPQPRQESARPPRAPRPDPAEDALAWRVERVLARVDGRPDPGPHPPSHTHAHPRVRRA